MSGSGVVVSLVKTAQNFQDAVAQNGNDEEQKIGELKQGIKTHPKNPRIWMQLFDFYNNRNMHHEAYKIAEKAFDQLPYDTEILYSYAFMNKKMAALYKEQGNQKNTHICAAMSEKLFYIYANEISGLTPDIRKQLGEVYDIWGQTELASALGKIYYEPPDVDAIRLIVGRMAPQRGNDAIAQVKGMRTKLGSPSLIAIAVAKQV